MLKIWSDSRKTFSNFTVFFIFLQLIIVPIVAFAAVPDTEVIKIPVQIGNSVFQLDAKVYKPQGDGPFPLIVLTHGTPRTANDRLKTNVDTYFKNQSEFFANMGYAVVFVVRRGFGNSNAPYAENSLLPNGTRDYTKAGLEAAKDLKATIALMKTMPYVDAKRIILLGQSTGGHSVIATGSLGIEGVIGIINFAGGRGSYAPDQVRDEGNLIASMSYYGKTSRVPTLWLYADNDHYFQPALAQSMYKAYTNNGGLAKFINLPPYGDDGHRSFVGNRSVWFPYIHQFLKDINPAS